MVGTLTRRRRSWVEDGEGAIDGEDNRHVGRALGREIEPIRLMIAGRDNRCLISVDNSRVNIGRPPDAEPAPAPPSRPGRADKVVKMAAALAAAAALGLIILGAVWEVGPFGEHSKCISAGAPTSVCVSER